MLRVLTKKGMLLFKRARPDLDPGFGFISFNVRSLTQNDWSKLAKIMSVMLGTQDEFLMLSTDDRPNLH